MRSMGRIVLILVTAALLLALSSCFVLEGYTSTGTLVLDNQSDDTIFFLYISRSNSDSWGDDVLNDSIIRPGEAYFVTLNSGYYDVQIANMFNIELDSIFSQEVLPGETTIITYH